MWQVARFYFVRFCKTERGMDELTGMSKDIRSKLSRIEVVLDRVCQYLAIKDSLKPGYFSVNSPVTLTDLAKELFAESGAKEFAEKHSDALLTKLEAEKPTNKLDVQKKANYIVMDASGKRDFDAIKNFVYENPIYKDKPLDLGTIVDIIALDLRDRYLAMHPEL